MNEPTSDNLYPNTEIYATAPDGTLLHWIVFQPSDAGPWPAALVMHIGGFKGGKPGPKSVAQDLAKAGFIAFAIEYHLAPPAIDMPEQKSIGYYPLQTNDVHLAIRAARHDPRCNGKVVAVGGSAGGSHAVYCAATGTSGDDRFDVVVSLSGCYDFVSAATLNDPLRRNVPIDVKNYVNSNDPVKLKAASPVNFIHADMPPIFIVETNNDPMPPSQFDALVNEFNVKGFNNYKTKIITEPNGPDGLTRHAFAYWVDVSSEMISFLKEKLSPSVPTPNPNPNPLSSTAVYTKGVWASMGVDNTVPQTLIDNKGIVGLLINEDWDKIETSDGVYNWEKLDAKIASAKAAGFKYISLAITNSSFDTPEWLRAELKANNKTVPLHDVGSVHNTYCQVIDVPKYWNARFHAKRLALVRAAGARYSSDPAIIAYPASFANQNSMDWNVQDKVGTLTGCPNGMPNVTVNQPAQWLTAGWTRSKMLRIGKEMCDTVAEAFPNQNIKLPIGGLAPELADAPIGSGGLYSTLAQEIVDYVATRPYANRFYIQRNTVDTNWGTRQSIIDNPPGPNSQRYIKKMIVDAEPSAGLQTVAYASECQTGRSCRQNGNLICSGPSQVMQDSLNVMLTYNLTFIEVWPQDAQNPDFYNMIKQATIAMGGTPRQ